MPFGIMTIFGFVTTIGAWATKALEDGKITASEGLELLQDLANHLGVPLEIDFTHDDPQPKPPIPGPLPLREGSEEPETTDHVKPEE